MILGKHYIKNNDECVVKYLQGKESHMFSLNGFVDGRLQLESKLNYLLYNKDTILLPAFTVKYIQIILSATYLK